MNEARARERDGMSVAGPRYDGVLAMLALSAFLLSGPDAGFAQPRIESYHGSWTVRCNLSGKQIGLCGASSRKIAVLPKKYGKMKIQIFVYRAKGRWFFQVVTPGNVDKAKGVRLDLDGQFVKTIPVVYCDRPDPCRAEIPFTGSLRKRFSSAKTATIGFATERKPRFEMTVKLNGLEDAMNAIARR